jgi:hypothetical protein
MRFHIEAILFDIDGTLVDSTGVVVRAWKTWAAKRGIEVEEILRVCHGRRTQDTVALFLPVQQRAAATAELEQLELADLDDVIALPATQTLLGDLRADRWAGVTSGSRALMRAASPPLACPSPTCWLQRTTSVSANPTRRAISKRLPHSATTSPGAWWSKTPRPVSKPAAPQERTHSRWPHPTAPRSCPRQMPSSLI